LLFGLRPVRLRFDGIGAPAAMPQSAKLFLILFVHKKNTSKFIYQS